MKRIAFAALLSLIAAGAGAQPMKCVDAKGKVRYVDESMIGTEKCEPVREGTSVVAPQAAPSRGENGETRSRSRPRPLASPDSGAQADARLAEAEEKLAQARRSLAEQEAIRLGNERNYARVQERLQPFQETVDRAAQEVEQLKRNSR